MIRAVLWDADGVLQVLPPFDSLWAFLPEKTRSALVADTFGSDGRDVLTGRIDMAEHVDAVIARHGLGAHRDEILAVWSRFPPVPAARDLLARVRRAGTMCVLATNQDTLREANMRPVYAALVDRCYFSSALGVAKPDTAFFDHIATDLAVQPEELLFIDDSADNVAGARAAGLCATQWHHSAHIDGLRGALVDHGLAI
ncbi:HAD-IA family hydrolase [Nocardioides terrisoli]|uniref:HAD-IA family hydrolase n=1 Tax=Nocardioides terrisoli TaxID=3388267 RepID=UPI00287B96D6|nr:HAD-IA family hydrolase [Nocardioides marmorisolisilvae]